MGRKQFKNAIKNKDYDKDDMELALDIWSSNSKIKKDFILNDYVEKPQSFIEDIFENEELKLESKIKSIKKEMGSLISKDFLNIYENERCILLAVGNPKTNHYLAVNYLRQKNDGESFGSGPTWCIADDENGTEMWREEYDFDANEYPNVYMLLSKKDSSKRYQITFHGESLENYFNNGGVYYEEEYNDEEDEWEEVPVNYEINDLFYEVRDIRQKLTERDGAVYEDIKKSTGLTQQNFIDIITHHINSLRAFKNNPKNEYYQLREDIEKCVSELNDANKDYDDLLKERIVDELDITKEKYDFKYIKFVLDFIKDIIKTNKNYNKEYIKIIFDFVYERFVNGDNKKSLENRLKKYDISLNDVAKILYLLRDKDNCYRNEFILSYLYIFHKNNPIKVEDLKNKGLSFAVHNYHSFNFYISEFISYEIDKCISGNLLEIFDTKEQKIDEIINQMIEIPFGLYTNRGEIEDEYVARLLFIQNIAEKEKIKLNPISKLMIYIASQQENKNYKFKNVNSDKKYFDYVLDKWNIFENIFKLNKDVAKKSYDLYKSLVEKDKSYAESPYVFLTMLFDGVGLISDKDKEYFRTVSGQNDLFPKKNVEKEKSPKPYEINPEFEVMFK